MLPQVRLNVSCDCRRGEAVSCSSPKQGTAWDLAAGALSLGIWALVPKCPVCLAAYVTLWTGLGFSFSEATYLRWSLLIASVALICYLAVRRAGAIYRLLSARPG
jgi:hypothetical protein